MNDRQKFAKLHNAKRVWVVASVHGESERLERLHDKLAPRLRPGDRIVYLGNMIGRGPAVRETLDALLRFRVAVMAGQHGFACDLAYLRGSQEEMWQKLLQIQFATDPPGTLAWMLDNGLAPTLEAYGSSAGEARRQASGGAIGLTRWTAGLRGAMQARPGHYAFFGILRRAAFTDDGSLLFVNSGLDPSRPLEAQKDSFWWSSAGFARIVEPYGTYRLIVRGFDPEAPGLKTTGCTVTVDGGCGFGGPLMAACVTPAGQVVETLEA
jgi:serine/threonine protein phosphatase 1